MKQVQQWNAKDFVPSKTCTGSFEGSDAPPIYLVSKEQECVSGKMILLADQVNKEGLFSVEEITYSERSETRVP